MRLLGIHQVVALLAKATGKYCLYISWDEDQLLKEDVVPSAPYIDLIDQPQIFCDGEAIVLCETEEEAWKYYHLTVGDDGPTKENSYDGPIRTYALLCGPDGKMWTENT